MAIRIDPRRLTLLKELAAGEGLRPGQLVQRWVEERLDAEREGRPVASPEGANRLAALEASLAALSARVEAIAQGAARTPAHTPTPTPTTESNPTPAEPHDATTAAGVVGEERPRRRGRPPKNAGRATVGTGPPEPASTERVALHEEIIAVISARGPSTAAEIAEAIRDRGRYHAPRSSRPLDAATVNSRVSNPVYRTRFTRSGRRIGLAG